MNEPASQAPSTEDRIATALERIAGAFEVIAHCLMTEQDADIAEPKRDPLRTMDDEPLPSSNGFHA